ncbi:MAG TPA: hypothetical protein VK790_09220 [Solirubrobacteraceae bacterium]|nr:hypothetical protein [Solirubrobacteraceae bacterium]
MFEVEPKIISFPGLTSRWSAPVRYLLSIWLTLGWLLRERPRVVIVCCPPPFASALVAIYARLHDASFILDAHPGAFGHRDKVWNLFVPLQKALVIRATATMVTEPVLGAEVQQWGGRPLIFHEAPPPLPPPRPRQALAARPKVVFATIFDPDEPLDVITDAASNLAECDVAITGDVSRLDQEYRRRLLAEPHVQLTGWLDQQDYLALIVSADLVVALTRDPHSVMRSAFEAIYLERPTVLSDTDTLRASFSPSVFVDGSSDGVVSGVRTVLAEYDQWVAQAGTRHEILIDRWESQREALKAAISEAERSSSKEAYLPRPVQRWFRR